MTNPFEVLKLGPKASAEEILQQAGRLCQRVVEETAVNEIRRAAQRLTGTSEERQLHELLTHPDPCYQWPTLESFVATHRRPPGPTTPTSGHADCAPLDLEEVAHIMRPLVAEALDAAPLSFEAVDVSDDVEEIRRQTLEGLWQTLPFDSTLS